MRRNGDTNAYVPSVKSEEKEKRKKQTVVIFPELRSGVHTGTHLLIRRIMTNVGQVFTQIALNPVGLTIGLHANPNPVPPSLSPGAKQVFATPGLSTNYLHFFTHFIAAAFQRPLAPLGNVSSSISAQIVARDERTLSESDDENLTAGKKQERSASYSQRRATCASGGARYIINPFFIFQQATLARRKSSRRIFYRDVIFLFSAYPFKLLDAIIR